MLLLLQHTISFAATARIAAAAVPATTNFTYECQTAEYNHEDDEGLEVLVLDHFVHVAAVGPPFLTKACLVESATARA